MSSLTDASIASVSNNMYRNRRVTVVTTAVRRSPFGNLHRGGWGPTVRALKEELSTHYVVEDDGFVTTYTVFMFYTTSSANTLFKVIVTVLCAQFLSGGLGFFEKVAHTIGLLISKTLILYEVSTTDKSLSKLFRKY